MVQDRRVQRTQRMLAEALVALASEHGYAAVTIRDITERAGVGYATFFRHYPDKDALLADAFDVVLAELMGFLEAPQPEADPYAVGTLLFQFVERQREVCHALLSSRGSATLRGRIVAAGTASVIAQNSARAGSPVPMEIAANHLVAASMDLIQWWLDHAMPYPAVEMGRIYHELIVRPTHAVAFAAPVQPIVLEP